MTFTESNSGEDVEQSVVWNNDDIKVRGLLPKIEEEKPLN